ncbi:MAG TPA: hypothetical protein VKV31_01670 [bacterium]|nr:hypothetical protein [bacterium]
MRRFKTSVYVDRELWERFKMTFRSRGLTRVLEEALEEKLLEESLEGVLPPLDNTWSVEVNFEPVTPKKSVSGLVKVGRRRREKSLSGQ